MIFSVIGIFFLITACSQSPSKIIPSCQNGEFDKEVKKYLSFSVPALSVIDLKNRYEHYMILDAREEEEFLISHLPEAQHIGYKRIDYDLLEGIPKDQPIVVYCSIGYRSEKVGEKLKTLGYRQVYNLYGSIFEWVNQGNQVIDSNGDNVSKVHTYNKKWGKWLYAENIEKIN